MEIWSGMFIPNADPESGSWFLTHPGSRGPKCTGSRIRDTVHWRPPWQAWRRERTQRQPWRPRTEPPCPGGSAPHAAGAPPPSPSSSGWTRFDSSLLPPAWSPSPVGNFKRIGRGDGGFLSDHCHCYPNKKTMKKKHVYRIPTVQHGTTGTTKEANFSLIQWLKCSRFRLVFQIINFGEIRFGWITDQA